MNLEPLFRHAVGLVVEVSHIPRAVGVLLGRETIQRIVGGRADLLLGVRIHVADAGGTVVYEAN